MNFKKALLPLFPLLLSGAFLGIGCTKKNPTDSNLLSSSQPPSVDAGTNPDTGSGDSSSATVGQVYVQAINVQQNQSVNLEYAFNTVSSQGNPDGVAGKAALVSADVANGDVEISVLNDKGVEVKFDRTSLQDVSTIFTPKESGKYTVVIKDNTGKGSNPSLANSSGAQVQTQVEDHEESEIAKNSNIMLKAVIVLARQCKAWSQDGNSTITTYAPAGEYFIQPFVFLGKVDANKKVAKLSSATVSIVGGGKTINLQTLSSLPVSLYREIGGISDAQHLKYTESFYHGYFGGAGELYTQDIFFFKGDCVNAKTIALDNNDPGATELKLNVVDNSLEKPLNESFDLRASIYPSGFYTYEASDVKLQDWTQCTYNKLTGAPITYNGDASECKKFSLSNLPYLKMEGVLPSAQNGSLSTSKSDPTRIMFYGHSVQKNLWVQIGANAAALASGSKTNVELNGCLNNGGLHAVPLNSDKTFLPLSQMNAVAGDVINLARRPGTYTGLPQFYQGNVNLSGSIDLPICLPSSSSNCGVYKSISVVTKNCKAKADSGISVLSISDSFVYPSYFEMSGVIEK